jgi:hypothetical protein
MKTSILSPMVTAALMGLAASVASLGLLVGCATLQQVATPERVRAVVALAGYESCTADVRGRPIERGKWLQVVGGLKVMVDANQWDGVTVAQALERAGISEVVCDEGQVAISGGLAFVDMFTGILQRAESATIVRAVVEGMLEGINLALDANAPNSRTETKARLEAAAVATRRK